MDLNWGFARISFEDLLSVSHEALFKGYENRLRMIRKKVGASDEEVDLVIAECEKKIKQAFFDAGRSLASETTK
jgi:hypothetical protein